MMIFAFADRLRLARNALGLNPKQAAAAARLNISVYYKLEQGERLSPSYATVSRLVAGGFGLEHFFAAADIHAAEARLRDEAERACAGPEDDPIS
jgi:transcriptional regulator with XRE-family HTH domain